MRLPNSAMQELSDVIGLIYETVIDDSIWTDVLERVCRFVGGSASRIYWRNASNANAETVHAWGFDPDFLKVYRERYVALNPLYPASIFIKPGKVFSSQDLVPPEEFQASRFFREWVAPQGFFDAAIFNIQRYQASAAAFTVITGKHYGAVDEELRSRLKLLAPHLQRAAIIGREIDKRQLRSQRLEEALDQVKAGVFILDEAGNATWANRAADTLLRQGHLVFAGSSRSGIQPLRLADPDANRLMKEGLTMLLTGEENTGDPRPAFIKMSDAQGSEWMGCLMRLQPESATQQAFGQISQSASAALFLRQADIVPESGIEAVARVYGLTSAETRVLATVIELDTIANMADTLGISANTVKKHLSSIFVKTGVSKRAALVKLALAAQL